jgi:ribosome-associated translation inhibitor RaiA
MYLPASKVLVADEKGQNISLAINKSFAALTRQLSKLKYRLEKHLRKRKSTKKHSLP